MDQSLIDAIVKLTGKTDEEVQTKLANVPIDDLYKLMDLIRTGDKASVIEFIDPIQESAYFRRTNEGLEYTAKFQTDTARERLIDWLDDNNIHYTNRLNNVLVVNCPDRDTAYRLSRKVTQLRTNVDTNLQTFKDMAEKPTKPGTPVPKPRDPMAKALALPQYQPKTTPSKKGLLDKAENKHKGRNEYNESVIEEGVMGMTGMDSMLPRLLTLAGCPPIEHDMDFSIAPQEVQSTAIEPAYGDVAFDVTDHADPVEITDAIVTNMTPIDNIRNSFKSISCDLSEIKVSEFTEVRTLLSDLMSQIDRMGNSITGK